MARCVAATMARGVSQLLHAMLLLVLLLAAAPTAPLARGQSAIEGPFPPAFDHSAPVHIFHPTGPLAGPHGELSNGRILDAPHTKFDNIFCNTTLVKHSFVDIGRPVEIAYEPVSDIRCKFGRVIFTLTFASKGLQYSRLATLWLGDFEIWRMTTPEGSDLRETHWNMTKDMTSYLNFWRQPQKLLFELERTPKFSGYLNVTLGVTFIDERVYGPQAPLADHILAYSTRRSSTGDGSAFIFPDDKVSLGFRLPHNTNRAVLSFTATPRADDELWWLRMTKAGPVAFPNVTLPVPGSYREIRIRVGGKLASLAWPFPVVSAGKLSPPLHQPAAGLRAFDLGEKQIELTPWLGVLCNGFSHKIGIEIVDDDGVSAPRYWVVSGKIFVWLDEPGSMTNGTEPVVETQRRSKPMDKLDPNDFYFYNQTFERNLRVTSHITRGRGHKAKTKVVSWQQNFVMTDDGLLDHWGKSHLVLASWRGEDKAQENFGTTFYNGFRWITNTRYLVDRDLDGSHVLAASLSQTEDNVVLGLSALPTGLEPFLDTLGYEEYRGTSTRSQRNATAIFLERPGQAMGVGRATVDWRYELGARYDREAPLHYMQKLLYKTHVATSGLAATQNKHYVHGRPKPWGDKPVPAGDVAHPVTLFDFMPVLGRKSGGGYYMFEDRWKQSELATGPGGADEGNSSVADLG